MGTRAKKYVHHAKTRALQRCGLAMDSKEFADAVREIREGRGVLVARESNTRSTYAFTVDGATCHVVYSHRAKAIVTVKTPEMF